MPARARRPASVPVPGARGASDPVPSDALPPHARPWPADHVPTPFQREVTETVAALQPGEVVTYSEIALELGRPRAAQAVANVLRCAPGLPWWRVVPSDGRVYGSHAPVQVPLLQAEGVRVDEHRRVHPPAPAPALGASQAPHAPR